MKLVIGLVLGLSVSAFAQQQTIYVDGKPIQMDYSLAITPVKSAMMAAGETPNGMAARIRVDEEGFVICSKRN